MKDEELMDDIIEKESKKLKHYVNNDKFLESMVEWKKEIAKAGKKGNILHNWYVILALKM